MHLRFRRYRGAVFSSSVDTVLSCMCEYEPSVHHHHHQLTSLEWPK